MLYRPADVASEYFSLNGRVFTANSLAFFGARLVMFSAGIRLSLRFNL
jgi:hypothetical protein